MRKVTLLSAALAIAVSIVIGCTATRKTEPIRPPLKLDAQERLGQAVFMRSCYQCHPGGEGGVGHALNDKPLPASMVKKQVRNGGGAMPPFSQQKISDDELTALTDYLVRLRSN